MKKFVYKKWVLEMGLVFITSVKYTVIQNLKIAVKYVCNTNAHNIKNHSSEKNNFKV